MSSSASTSTSSNGLGLNQSNSGMTTDKPSNVGVRNTPAVIASRRDKPMYSLIAGATAGAVEGFVTYPIEYTKTVAQFTQKQGEKPPGPISIVRSTVAKEGIKGLYNGCGALVTGNALKAGVRFLAFDHFKTLLRDDQGRLSGPRSLLAGLGAGMTEAVFAVTPSETIKTKLIDDGKRAVRKYPPTLIGGTAAIIREEGITGIYRGLFPVMLRQGSNSMVRLGSYSTLKNLVQGSARPGQTLPGGVTFAIGALAGVITVYTTMPFDTVKTRMQSLDARQRYTGTINCFTKTVREEGVRALWRGSTTRLARLVLSGGIVFTIYEEMMALMGGATV